MDFDPLTGGPPCAFDATKMCVAICEYGIAGPCVRQSAGDLLVERKRVRAMLIRLRRRIAEFEVSLDLARREEAMLVELLGEQG